MNNEFAKAFGERLKYYRKKKGLSRQDMVDRLDISRASTIGLYEQGRVQPTLEGLKKIAEILEVSVDTLLNGTVKDSIEVCINQWREVGFEIEKRDERYIIKNEVIARIIKDFDDKAPVLTAVVCGYEKADFITLTRTLKTQAELAFKSNFVKNYADVFNDKTKSVKNYLKNLSSAD